MPILVGGREKPYLGNFKGHVGENGDIEVAQGSGFNETDPDMDDDEAFLYGESKSAAQTGQCSNRYTSERDLGSLQAVYRAWSAFKVRLQIPPALQYIPNLATPNRNSEQPAAPGPLAADSGEEAMDEDNDSGSVSIHAAFVRK